MSTDPAKMATDFRAAATLIRKNGLAKGKFHNPDTNQYCTVGAVTETSWWNSKYATNAHERLQEECLLLADLLGEQPIDYDSAWMRVAAWNDLDTTTDEDAATLLEQAAEKLEADLS